MARTIDWQAEEEQDMAAVADQNAATLARARANPAVSAAVASQMAHEVDRYAFKGLAGDLGTRAMLVDLTIKQWSARKTDKNVSAEVAANHSSDASMGRYWKNLLAPERMEPLRKLAVAAQSEHRKRTLPWLDSGARILTGAGYADYRTKMREFEEQYRLLVGAFIAEYDVAREEARKRLNGLFNPSDYPPAHDVARRFMFAVDPLPFPSADDFRLALSDGETEVIRQRIAERANAALAQAMADVYRRVLDVAASMEERLAAYHVDADGSVSGIFRDSLVSNVRALVELLPSLNVAGDPKLDELTDRMRVGLCKYDPATLRDSQQAREETAQAAARVADEVEQVLQHLSEFI